MDAIIHIGLTALNITKLIVILYFKDNMYVIVRSAIKDWSNPVDKDARVIMLKYAYTGNLVCKIQIYGFAGALIPMFYFSLPSFVMHSYELSDNSSKIFRNIPIGPNCLISPVLPVNLYLAYYLFSSLDSIVFAISFFTPDLYGFAIIMHICGQFKVLSKNMENLNGREDYSILREKINHFTERHRYLLELVNKFEESFNLMLLIQLAFNMLVISISGELVDYTMYIYIYSIVQAFCLHQTGILGLVAMKNGDTNLLFPTLSRIIVLYIQLFLYSYSGEQLSTQAEILKVAIYNCSWYRMQPSLIKDLSFILMRNNYPFHLTAGKIFDMNFSSFKNIIKTTFSYFSMLRLMFDE